MFKTARIALAMVAALAAFNSHAAVITSDTYNGNTYLLLSQQNWFNAETEAQSLGGHLVTVNDDAENDWLWSTFQSYGNLWIGLNDIAAEGTYVWSSGQSSTYLNWASGEPNNCCGGEDAVHFWGGINAWNDLNAFSNLYAIAEIEAVPAPAALVLLGMGLLGLGFRRQQ